MQESQKTRVPSLRWEDPLEEEIATHSGILAWKIPWTEEPSGLCSPQGPTESDTTEYSWERPVNIIVWKYIASDPCLTIIILIFMPCAHVL